MRIILMLIALVPAGGCATRYYPVEGVLTMDDKPIEGAMITFTPDGNGANLAIAQTDKDGHFRLNSPDRDGVPAGSYTASVVKTVTRVGGKTVDFAMQTKSPQGDPMQRLAEAMADPAKRPRAVNYFLPARQFQVPVQGELRLEYRSATEPFHRSGKS